MQSRTRLIPFIASVDTKASLFFYKTNNPFLNEAFLNAKDQSSLFLILISDETLGMHSEQEILNQQYVRMLFPELNNSSGNVFPKIVEGPK